MYKFVQQHSQAYPVDALCHTVGVSRSAYYAFLKGQTYQPIDETKSEQVKAIFGEHKRRYGSRRIVHALRAKGQKIGRDFVRSVLLNNGLSAIQRQRPTVS